MSISIGLPQAIFLLLNLIGIFLSIRDHGKLKEENAESTCIGFVFISIPLLYWGGFFS